MDIVIVNNLHTYLQLTLMWILSLLLTYTLITVKINVDIAIVTYLHTYLQLTLMLMSLLLTYTLTYSKY